MGGALILLPYMCLGYHTAGLRLGGALPPLPFMCLLNFLLHGWFENGWSSTSTTLNVFTDLFIMASLRIGGALLPLPNMCPPNLSRDWVENGLRSTQYHTCLHIFSSRGWVENINLYLYSPYIVHWTYHVAGLRIGGALPPLPYMCPLILSCGWVENFWSPTSTLLHVSPELFITWLGWEYLWQYLQFPICVLRDFITWLGSECVDLYPDSATCVHCNFYHMAVLRIGGALTPLPYVCPSNLSHGWVENGLSFYRHSPCVHSTYHVAGLRKGAALPSPPTCVEWIYHVAGLKICVALPPLPYMCTLNITWLGWE